MKGWSVVLTASVAPPSAVELSSASMPRRLRQQSPLLPPLLCALLLREAGAQHSSGFDFGSCSDPSSEFDFEVQAASGVGTIIDRSTGRCVTSQACKGAGNAPWTEVNLDLCGTGEAYDECEGKNQRWSGRVVPSQPSYLFFLSEVAADRDATTACMNIPWPRAGEPPIVPSKVMLWEPCDLTAPDAANTWFQRIDGATRLKTLACQVRKLIIFCDAT